MTGGQFSPTTPMGDKGTTAPFGNIDKSFDICKLAEGAGATYVARSTAYHAKQMTDYVKKGIQHKGFALIEGMSTCPTYYGRKNKKGGAVGLLEGLKNTFVDIKVKDKLAPEKLEGKLFMGEFKNTIEPEYNEQYNKIMEMFSAGRDE